MSTEAVKTVAEYQAAVDEIVAVCAKHQVALVPMHDEIEETSQIVLLHKDNRWAQGRASAVKNVVRIDVDVVIVDLIKP